MMNMRITMSTDSGSMPGGKVKGEERSHTALWIVPIGGLRYKGFVWITAFK